MLKTFPYLCTIAFVFSVIGLDFTAIEFAHGVEPDPADEVVDRLIELQSEPGAIDAFRRLLEERVTGEAVALPAQPGDLVSSRATAILQQHCVECHGPAKQRSGFDLSNREGLLAGGDEGVSVVAGDVGASRLITMLRHEAEPHMPHKKERLAEVDIQAIADWIGDGADYGVDLDAALVAPSGAGKRGEMIVTDADRSFWSFRPLARAEAPATKNAAWNRNAIDSFVLARLEAEGLRPSGEADRRTLVRRAYFDLLGLPPTPEEIAQFVSDNRPDAYERLVDRLLESPHYGERWGRHWLDIARYADSAGYEFDFERPTAYHYRDFVISALNDDMPFDQFVRWQLAGDEYEPDNRLAVAATGFCTSGPNVNNQETELNRYNELDDVLSTTASAVLGLTVGCARCHDHKYDPIPSRDYYRMLSAFTGTERHEAFLTTRPERDVYLAKKKEWDGELAGAQKALARFEAPFRAEVRLEKIAALDVDDEKKAQLREKLDRKNEEQKKLFNDFKKKLKASNKELGARMADGESAAWQEHKENIEAAEADPPPSPPRGLALKDGKAEAETSYFLRRGNPESKDGEVRLAFLRALPGAESDRFQPARFRRDDIASTFQRTALAEWLTDVDEGAGRLTARVISNRLWHYHFGRGIVGTPGDFGMQGDRPTHPELLDWLATELIARDWSLKALHRLMMTSSVYRQSSAADPKRAAIDPDNRFLWHRAPSRLEAEVIRDSMLAVSGSLNDEMFGPGIHPFMHPNAIATGSDAKWPKDIVDGPATWRRSVYIFIRRSALMPMMQAFDSPDATASCARRNTTTIPIQSLAMMNSPFVSDQAARLAARLEGEAGDSVEGQIGLGYLLALGRRPTVGEGEQSLAFIREQAATYDSPESALVDFCQVLLSMNEFVYVD